MVNKPTGPAPPEGGYPTPDKYVPSNLGEKKVWETQADRLQLTVPPAALRYLDAEQGDVLKFEEGDESVIISKTNNE